MGEILFFSLSLKVSPVSPKDKDTYLPKLKSWETTSGGRGMDLALIPLFVSDEWRHRSALCFPIILRMTYLRGTNKTNTGALWGTVIKSKYWSPAALRQSPETVFIFFHSNIIFLIYQVEPTHSTPIRILRLRFCFLFFLGFTVLKNGCNHFYNRLARWIVSPLTARYNILENLQPLSEPHSRQGCLVWKTTLKADDTNTVNHKRQEATFFFFVLTETLHLF